MSSYRLLVISDVSGSDHDSICPVLGSKYLSLVLPLIEKAKISIDIAAYSWTFKDWERNNSITIFTKAIMKARKRGVAVRVVLNSESRSHYLTISNKRTIKKISSVGIEAKMGRSSPITHCKMILVDNVYTVIGSHNLTGRSVTSNDETSIIIKGRSVNKIYKDYFLAIWRRP